MKKLFFLAVAAIALLTTSCERVQSTEVSEQNLKDKVTISGYARYIVVNSKGESKDPEMLEDQDLILYYGMKDAEGNMVYTHYDLKTDEDGYFATTLGVKPGQVIDEVKVQCSFSLEDATYAWNKVAKKYEKTNADFFGETVKQNLAAGSSYVFVVEAKAVAYTSNPDLEQPDEDKLKK